MSLQFIYPIVLKNEMSMQATDRKKRRKIRINTRMKEERWEGEKMKALLALLPC